MIIDSGVHRVAAVQFPQVDADPTRSLKRACGLVFRAASLGARLVVLPELCLSGRSFDSFAEAGLCAQTCDGYQTAAVHDVAARHDCYVVFGHVESRHGVLHNSATIVGPDGWCATARKHNLAGRDRKWATGSTELSPIVVTPFGRLGVLIGRDALNNYRESYEFHKVDERFYRRGSVDVLCLLIDWDGADYPDSSWIDLAEELDVNVVVAGSLSGESRGGSCVIDRALNVHWRGSNDGGTAVVGGFVVV